MFIGKVGDYDIGHSKTFEVDTVEEMIDFTQDFIDEFVYNEGEEVWIDWKNKLIMLGNGEEYDGEEEGNETEDGYIIGGFEEK